MRKLFVALLAGVLAVSLINGCGRDSDRPKPRPQPPALASCTDATGDGTAGLDLTQVKVSTVGPNVFWNFTYEGSAGTGIVVWSSLSKLARKQHVLEVGSDKQVKAQFVRDLATSRRQESALPVTFTDGQISMAFPATVVDIQTLKGSVASVAIKGVESDRCELR